MSASDAPIAVLTPRLVAARASATCSEMTLDIRITYASDLDARTPLQRQIEATMAPSDTPRRMLLGDLEFYFADGAHLAGIALYANFAASLDAGPPITGGDEVWLTFPDLEVTDRDVLHHDMPVLVAADRAAGRVRLTLGGPRPCRYHRLADGLTLGLDEAGRVGGLIVDGVAWIRDDDC